MNAENPGFVFAVALGSGVLAQALARHLRISGIVVLLGVGVALGPDGMRFIDPRSLGEGLFALVRLAVAVILFEGGMNLELRRLRQERATLRMLLTLGATVTAIGATLAAHVILGWPWTQSVLFGTLVIVTGPTVVTPVLRNIRVQRRVSTVLEAEGVLIDPIGVLVAVLALEVVVAPAASSVTSAVTWLVLRIGFGTLAGMVFGLVLAWLLRTPRVIPEGYENIVTLGGVLLLFVGCNFVLSESGILAATISGIMVGNFQTRIGRQLRRFEEQLTVMLIGLLFVLLAADVRVAQAVDLGWAGLATVGALIFLVRPAKVFLSTLRSDLVLREKLFLCWLAPRGIVAASIASFVSSVMEVKGISGAAELRAMVFLTIAITVIAQGGTGEWVAKLLRLQAPPRDAVAILGAEGLGMALGNELRSAGARVVFYDANPAHCRVAEQAGYTVVFGNALDERLLARGRLEQAAVAIGLTSNSAVNSLFAREAMDDFGVPEAYVAVDSIDPGPRQEKVERQRGKVLFDGPKDLGRWNVRFRHGEVRVEHFRYRGDYKPPRSQDASAGAKSSGQRAPQEGWVLLAIHRKKRSMPMHAGLKPDKGDTGAFLLYAPTAEEARKALKARGWEPTSGQRRE